MILWRLDCSSLFSVKSLLIFYSNAFYSRLNRLWFLSFSLQFQGSDDYLYDEIDKFHRNKDKVIFDWNNKIRTCKYVLKWCVKMAVITAYYKYSPCLIVGGGVIICVSEVFPQIFKIWGQNKMALWSFGNLALNWWCHYLNEWWG